MRPAILLIIAATAAGTAARALEWACDVAQNRASAMQGAAYWPSLALATLSFAAIALLADRIAPASRGSGVPPVLAMANPGAADVLSPLLSLKVAMTRIGLLLPLLLCGASLGRTGPSLALGCAIILTISRWTPFTLPSLAIAGAASGLAGAFGAPLAGVVFGWEVGHKTTSPWLSLAAIPAGLVAKLLGGGASSAVVLPPWPGSSAWLGAIICGLIVGLAIGGFALVLYSAAAASMRAPLIIVTLCGIGATLCLAASGFTTSGTGSIEIAGALHGQSLPLGLAPLKAAATVLAGIARLPGGLISPNLAIGAALGTEVARFTSLAPMAILALLGIAAAFAGLLHAPLTAAVLTLGFCPHLDLAAPIVLASLLGFGVSRLVCRAGLFQALGQTLLQLPRTAA